MLPENGFFLKNKQLTLYLYVQPRSSRTDWGQIHNNRIKLCVSAAPVNGQANKQCISFIAKSLKVSKSSISILQGESSRNKTILVNNIDLEFWDSTFRQILNVH
ncbi:MAG: DUF167 domain-containing protein [SAR324 cluster bacterium]|nr:DUF167 domain-containing protein [SAR324 cluster bacterium]